MVSGVSQRIEIFNACFLMLQNLNDVTSGDAPGYLTVIQDIMDKNLADDQVKTTEIGNNGAGTDRGGGGR